MRTDGTGHRSCGVKEAIPNCWGDQTAAIADLIGPNGVIVSTDATWQSGLLPIRKSGIYFGEIYDAREEKLADTHGTVRLPFDKALLVAHETAPVRELPAARAGRSAGRDARRANWSTTSARTSAAMSAIRSAGQGRRRKSAWSTPRCSGPTATSTTATIAPPDAHTHLHACAATANETYAPHFSFQGFRYARLTGSGRRGRIVAIASVPITSVAHI